MIETSISRKKHYFNNRQRYAWPNPFETEEQAQKFIGADIDSMTELDRWLELKRLENILPWLDKKKILFTDLSRRPARSITRLNWALQRLKRLNGLPDAAGIGKYLKTISR